jgi:hypothetical protein
MESELMQQNTPNPEIQSLEELIASWKNSPYPSIKISSYFPAYVELFGHLRGTDCTFIETGILDGGSLFMWRNWLGEKARIIGIDLNPEALKWKEHGFEIYIGDQGDPSFWKATLKQIGKFDALLDDGGHQSFQQIVTAYESIRFAKNKCVIAIEDTVTSFMKDFSKHGKHTFLEFSKDATDLLIFKCFDMYPRRLPSSYNRTSVNHFKDVFSIKFFNGIVAFQVDPINCATPEVVRNRKPNSATDFRYEGKKSALIEWPKVLRRKNIVVKGGTNYITKIRKFRDSIRKFRAFMREK